MAKAITIALLAVVFVAMALWLPAFLRPGAREIRERALTGTAGDESADRDYPLLPPDQRGIPRGKVRIGPGDSLWSILKDSFPKASNEELSRAVKVTALSNGMRNPSALRVGQEITIPTSLRRTLAAH